nr:unnamed protein product [Callosobruchus analis]
MIEEATALKYKSALATVFTPGQIKKLFGSGNKRIVGRLMILHLQFICVTRKHIALSTLRKWVASSDVSHEILRSVITLMQKKSADFMQHDRICVLTFDEVYISNKIEIDKKLSRS